MGLEGDITDVDTQDEGWVLGWEREAGGRTLGSGVGGEVGTESPVSWVSVSERKRLGGLDSSI